MSSPPFTDIPLYIFTKKHPDELTVSGLIMVPRARLELATHGFSVHCSTGLSYLGTLFGAASF
jgi:hypothetical protein